MRGEDPGLKEETIIEQRDPRWDAEMGMATLGPGHPSEFGCRVIRLVLEKGRGVLGAVMETKSVGGTGKGGDKS